MGFTQTMTVQANSADELIKLLDGWHREQAGVAPGYQGGRILADQDVAGRFVLEIDFTDRASAEQNNARPETDEWAKKLQGIAQGAPEYHNYELAHETR